jgi:hypothetical protein
MAEEYKAPPEEKPTNPPENVVGDNSGVIPVQPIATTDPTLDDNTNPRVPFDGGDPRNIPPHDSNEQLHIAAGKRIGAEVGNLERAAKARRAAVVAAYDNDKDVRDVLGDDTADPGAEGVHETVQRSGGADATHERAARSTPPQGRQSKTQSSSKS